MTPLPRPIAASRSLRTLLVLAAFAVAVPLVPFLAFGTRLDEAVARRLDPPPPPLVTAAIEVAVLAADLLLPVPSSMVATLGGAQLGVVAGTACAWLGMTAGALAGWWIGRIARGGSGRGAPDDDRARAAGPADPAADTGLCPASYPTEHTPGEKPGQLGRGLPGPLVVVLTRPVPLVAEATAIMAGGAGMDWRTFLVAAGSGNLAIALVWTLAGSLGRQADSLQWAVVAALFVPVALTWLVLRRSLQTPSGGV